MGTRRMFAKYLQNTTSATHTAAGTSSSARPTLPCCRRDVDDDDGDDDQCRHRLYWQLDVDDDGRLHTVICEYIFSLCAIITDLECLIEVREFKERERWTY